MKKLALDGAVSAEEIFKGANTKKGGINKSFARKNKSETGAVYCAKVFLYFIFLVLEDIIENNITFEFPCLYKKEAKIYVKCYSDEEFTKMYKRGKFKGIDFIASGFKGYELTFQGKYDGYICEKPIHIDRTLNKRFYELINNGKQYY